MCDPKMSVKLETSGSLMYGSHLNGLLHTKFSFIFLHMLEEKFCLLNLSNFLTCFPIHFLSFLFSLTQTRERNLFF